MQETLFDTPVYWKFGQLEEFGRLPDESTTLRFRNRLEKHRLAEQILAVVNDILIQRGLLLKLGTVVDATLIAAPSFTKNKHHKRDPDMHSSKNHQVREPMSLGMWHVARQTQGVEHRQRSRCLESTKPRRSRPVRAKVEHPFRVI